MTCAEAGRKDSRAWATMGGVSGWVGEPVSKGWVGDGHITSGDDWPDWARRASGELAAALNGAAPGEMDRMADDILAARRIVCAGMGREGLMVRALGMRLMHLGFDAHVAFDMTTPRSAPATC